jgi:hypothetical protein
VGDQGRWVGGTRTLLAFCLTYLRHRPTQISPDAAEMNVGSDAQKQQLLFAPAQVSGSSPEHYYQNTTRTLPEHSQNTTRTLLAFGFFLKLLEVEGLNLPPSLIALAEPEDQGVAGPYARVQRAQHRGHHRGGEDEGASRSRPHGHISPLLSRASPRRGRPRCRHTRPPIPAAKHTKVVSPS